MSQIEQSILGKACQYPTEYSPQVLFAIERAPNRQQIAQIEAISQGMDWWHGYELSWLDSTARPRVAIIRFSFDPKSTFLVESKSLKLYLNSLNFCQFAQTEDLIACIKQDLSALTESDVGVELLPVDDLAITQPIGECIDQSALGTILDHPDGRVLTHAADAAEGEYSVYSHLLRSNCPVTGQPDWGTLMLRYRGRQFNHATLLSYILSYRAHQGFHEQCVEQIFADIWQQLKPYDLMVYAAYTRRGGLDIHPCRVSRMDWLPQPMRLARQ